jgi:hypothetical protein
MAQPDPNTYLQNYFANEFASIADPNILTHRLAGGNSLMSMMAREGNTDALKYLFGGDGVTGALPQSVIPQVLASQGPTGITNAQQLLNAAGTNTQVAKYLGNSDFGKGLIQLVQSPEFAKLANNPEIQKLAGSPEVQQLAQKMLQSGEVQNMIGKMTANLTNSAGSNLGSTVSGLSSQANSLFNTVKGLGMTGGNARKWDSSANEFSLSPAKTAALRREMDLEGGHNYEDYDIPSFDLTEVAARRRMNGGNEYDDDNEDEYNLDDYENDFEENDDLVVTRPPGSSYQEDSDDDLKIDVVRNNPEFSKDMDIVKDVEDDDVGFDLVGVDKYVAINNPGNAIVGDFDDESDYDSDEDWSLTLAQNEREKKIAKNAAKNNPAADEDVLIDVVTDDDDDADAEVTLQTTKYNPIAFGEESGSDEDDNINVTIDDEDLRDLDEVDEDSYTQTQSRVRDPANDEDYKKILDRIIELMDWQDESKMADARLYRVALKTYVVKESDDKLKGNKNEAARNKRILELVKNKKTLQDTIKKVDLEALRKELDAKRREYEEKKAKTTRSTTRSSGPRSAKRSASSKSVTSKVAKNNPNLSSEDDHDLHRRRRLGKYSASKDRYSKRHYMYGGFLDTDQLSLS